MSWFWLMMIFIAIAILGDNVEKVVKVLEKQNPCTESKEGKGDGE